MTQRISAVAMLSSDTTDNAGGKFAAVLASPADIVRDPNISEILTNLGSFGRGKFGQGFFGNQR